MKVAKLSLGNGVGMALTDGAARAFDHLSVNDFCMSWPKA